MMNLFYAYNRLFPGMSGVIMDTIKTAESAGRAMGLEGKALQDYVEDEILDRVDP